MDYWAFYSTFMLLLMLDILSAESNDQTQYSGNLKKMLANVLNSIVTVNKERLKTQEKLNKLNDNFGKEILRTLFDGDGIDPQVSFVVMDLDGTKPEAKIGKSDVHTLVKALESLYQNKLNPNLNNVINLQKDNTENDKSEFLKEEPNLVRENYEDRDSPDFTELRNAILSLNNDDSSAEKYLRKLIGSTSGESDSEEPDLKSLEKFHDQDYNDHSQIARGSSISCWRGRKLCRAACRESARDFCKKYNFRRCSYRSKCRRACRMWF